MQSSDEIRSKCRRCVGFGVALGLNIIVDFAAAQSAPQETPPPEHTTSRLSWAELVPLPIEPQGLPADITELCEGKLGSEPGWIDRLHRGLYRTICLSAAGFDGFFGNARFDDEYQATHGSVAVGTLWDQRDHWDPSIRFRVQLRLPQMSERFSAFVGRVNPDEYVSDLRDDFDTLPGSLRRKTMMQCCWASGTVSPAAAVGTSMQGWVSSLTGPWTPTPKAPIASRCHSSSAISFGCRRRSSGRRAKAVLGPRRASTWSVCSERPSSCAGLPRAPIAGNRRRTLVLEPHALSESRQRARLRLSGCDLRRV